MEGFEFSRGSTDFETLNKYSDERLIAIVQNFEQHDLKESSRYTAIKILEERNYSLKKLQLSGKLLNSKYKRAKSIVKSYKKATALALVMYLYMVLVWPLTVFVELPEIVVDISYLLIFITYVILVVKSGRFYSEFYKVIGKKEKFNPGVAFFFGSIVFFITYFSIKKELEQEMKNLN